MNTPVPVKGMVIVITIMSMIMMHGCSPSPETKKASQKEAFTQLLLSKKWIGKVSNQPVELGFTMDNNVLQAELIYTYFTKPGVQEKMSVEITDTGTVFLKGTSYQRIIGLGKFALDTLSGKLSADSAEISGTIRDPYHPEGAPWSVSSRQKIEDVDLLFDMKKAESALLNGQWVGVAQNKPAVIQFGEKQGNLTAQIKVAKTTTNLEVDINENGLLIMKSQPKPSGQSLVTETYNGKFNPDYQTIIGAYEKIIKQGFTESSYGGAWGFENKKK